MTISRLIFWATSAGAMVVLSACGAGSADPSDPNNTPKSQTLATDAWTYIQVDSNKTKWGNYDPDYEWLRYFGLDAGDLNGDGMLDLVSGRTLYLNPGGNMTGTWEKVDLGQNVDGNLIYRDAGGKSYVLGQSLPDVLRFPVDANGRPGPGEVVAQVPPTGHYNGQGYRMGDVLGDERPEVIYASQGGLYALRMTDELPWKTILVGADASDEGFAVADMDADGDNDLVAGYRVPGEDAEKPTVLVWFENPGPTSGNAATDWTRHSVGTTTEAIDRVEAADLNADGRTDVVVAEEMYPGKAPLASLWTFTRADTGFVRKRIVRQFSMNNLDVADVDNDGDADILTAEHKGPVLNLQLWLNDGAGDFTLAQVDRGKESHLGTRAYDLDGDGDLDIVSIGWDRYELVHVWRNDAL